ncbi:MAG: flagellar hook-basal body complex protein FliE [Desulfobulbaceae bacterium]|nr:flagellar hook-basal body complex protein FliE [Desulfobulbaceae bacterium]
MKDITLVSQLNALRPVGNAAPVKPVGEGFADVLKTAVSQVNDSQVAANSAIEKFQTGETRDLHEVMITMEKADISMRLMMQVRNKVVDAYQEIMRMQV